MDTYVLPYFVYPSGVLSVMFNMSTSKGIVGTKLDLNSLPLLVNPPAARRDLTVARKPLSEPSKNMVSWSLEMSVIMDLHSLSYHGKRWRICSLIAAGFRGVTSPHSQSQSLSQMLNW